VGVQQRAGGDYQHPAGLGLARRRGGQQQPQVAVGDPPGVEDLAVGVAAKLAH
jgi:hypothetical protein